MPVMKTAFSTGLPGSVRRHIFSAVLLILCLAAPSSHCGEGFHFVQISDIHFDGGRNTRRMEHVVEAVNKLPMQVEFVAITGDIMADNIEREEIVAQGLEILSRIKAPLSLLPGNHDILVNKLEQTLPLYRKHFGELSHKREVGGVIMLFLYTEPLRKKFQVEGYDPAAWLAKELDSAQNKPVVIFHHSPSSTDFYNNQLHDSWPPDEVEKWEKLASRPNVKAIICGHFHRAEQHWLGNVPIYVGTAVAHYWGREPTYRIYHYDQKNGRLSYSTQYIENLKEEEDR